MITLGVLVSGTGTNLQALLDAIASSKLDARIGVVVSNVPGAGALKRAQDAGVKTVVVDHTQYTDRCAFDAAVVEALRAHGVELVVLAGFMRLVTDVLLDAYPMRIVNVHPALLPAFPGLHAQRQAVDYGVRVSGVTVHLVDAGTAVCATMGPESVPVHEGDDEESLRKRILKEEHALLPRVLQWFSEGRVTVEPAPPGKRAKVRVAGG